MMYFKIVPQSILSTPAPTDAYFRQAWAFCQSYLSGQQDFTLQTSGSTGQPKSITLTRAQMQASATATRHALGLQMGQHALVCLNVGYIAGTMMLVRGLEIGLTMYVVVPSSNPFLSLSPTTSLDFGAFVPLQLQTLLDNNQHESLNQFKVLIVGGAAVNAQLLEQIQALTVPVYSTYGMTETVSHVALRKLNGRDASDSFGLLDGIEATTDSRGCLQLKGVVTGGEWVQTNDLITWIDHRHFRLIGRADNIINSGGVKIQLEKVEQAIENNYWKTPARFFVWWIPDERLGQKLVLALENTPAPDFDDFKSALAAFLSSYEIPKEVIVFEKFVETPTGKVDKQRTFAQNT